MDIETEGLLINMGIFGSIGEALGIKEKKVKKRTYRRRAPSSKKIEEHKDQTKKAFQKVKRDFSKVMEVIQDHTQILQNHDGRLNNFDVKFNDFEGKIVSLEDKILKEPISSIVEKPKQKVIKQVIKQKPTLTISNSVDLTQTQLLILQALADDGGDRYLGYEDIAMMINKTPGAIKYQMNEMKKRGIELEAISSDRNQKRYKVNSKVKDILKRK